MRRPVCTPIRLPAGDPYDGLRLLPSGAIDRDLGASRLYPSGAPPAGPPALPPGADRDRPVAQAWRAVAATVRGLGVVSPVEHGSGLVEQVLALTPTGCATSGGLSILVHTSP